MTPEAKLLELIKNSAPGKNGLKRAAKRMRSRTARFSTGLQNMVQRCSRAFAHLSWPQRVNRLLLAGSLLTMSLMLVKAVVPSRPPEFLRGETARSPLIKGKAAAGAKEVLWEDVTRRNLFRPLIAPPPPPPKIIEPVTPLPPKIPLSQRMSHLRLVGLMNSTPPQAILEDQRSQKTFYVSVGQGIDDAEVEKITNNQVILKSADERYTLTM